MNAQPFTSLTIPKFGYSLAETEVACGLSRATLYRLLAAGKLRTVQHGRRRIIPAEEIARLMGSCEESAA